MHLQSNTFHMHFGVNAVKRIRYPNVFKTSKTRYDTS